MKKCIYQLFIIIIFVCSLISSGCEKAYQSEFRSPYLEQYEKARQEQAKEKAEAKRNSDEILNKRRTRSEIVNELKEAKGKLEKALRGEHVLTKEEITEILFSSRRALDEMFDYALNDVNDEALYSSPEFRREIGEFIDNSVKGLEEIERNKTAYKHPVTENTMKTLEEAREKLKKTLRGEHHLTVEEMKEIVKLSRKAADESLTQYQSEFQEIQEIVTLLRRAVDASDLNNETPAYSDINARDEEGFTTLHQAVRTSNFTKFKDLIEKGADVNSKDNDGKTPLHYAIDQNELEFIEILIANGADVYARDNENNTPLHLAKNFEMSRRLIESWNDFHSKNEERGMPYKNSGGVTTYEGADAEEFFRIYNSIR